MRLLLALFVVMLVGCSKPDEKPSVANSDNVIEKESPQQQSVELPPLIEPSESPADGILLRLKLVSGTKENREISGNVRIDLDKKKVKPGQSPIIDSILAINYSTEVLESGSGKMRVRIVSKPIQATTSSGTSSSQSEDFSVVFDELGNPLENYSGLVRSALSAGFIRFPKSRLKPGSSWSLNSEREVPILGIVKYTEKYTFRGTMKRNGQDAWHIEIRAIGSDKLSTKGNYYLNPKNGSLLDAEIYQEIMTEIPQENGSIPAKISMTARLKPKSGSI